MKDILYKEKLFPQRRCPFCDAAGEKKTEKNEETGIVMHYIQCVKCGTQTKKYRLLADAVTHWDSQVNNTKQRQGHWEYKIEDGYRYIECSACGQQYSVPQDGEVLYTKYCPECGARLVQRDQTGVRKISIDDQVEMGERIRYKKKNDKRKETVEKYRQQELAEDVLRRLVANDDV